MLLGEDAATGGRVVEYFFHLDSVKEKLHLHTMPVLCLNVLFWREKGILRLYDCRLFFPSGESLSKPLTLNKLLVYSRPSSYLFRCWHHRIGKDLEVMGLVFDL